MPNTQGGFIDKILDACCIENVLLDKQNKDVLYIDKRYDLDCKRW